MVDRKISQLPEGTTPLAGTELVEIVQEGDNVRVPASAFGGGGGGDLTVVATDFTAATIASNNATPAAFSTISIPANTLTGTRKLEIESLISITASGANQSNKFDIEVLLAGTVIGKRRVFQTLGGGTSFPAMSGGWVRMRASIQAANSAAAQFNSATYEENANWASTGVFDLVVVMAFNGTTPAVHSTTLDMTTDQDLVIRVTGAGSSADVVAIHRYTKVMRIGA
jgi:hypothetical protein